MNTVKLKNKKTMLVLPILVIPFLTMAFWALGGGKGKTEKQVTAGLNLDLPDANLKEDKGLDKLSFYDKADKDSEKLQEYERNDPYFKKDTVPDYPNELEQLTTNKYTQRLNNSIGENNNKPEDQIMQRLKDLQNELNKPSPTPELNKVTEETEPKPEYVSSTEEDPDIKQLNGALDKILDIQHPQRVKERSLKNREAAYAVRRDNGPDTLVNGFYSYSDARETEEQNAVEAIIAANQVIVNGAVIKFRTTTEMYVNGKLVPANNIISGIASLDGERLMVEINSIRTGKNLFSVKLEVYDMDGLPGIYIPGTINRDVAKESANNSLQLMELTSMDPSFKAQATATGIGALKSLISKKVKLVKVQVKAGYKVLLKNKNQDQ